MVGDAAHCASPYSGMGVSGGLVGAYVPAGEINRRRVPPGHGTGLLPARPRTRRAVLQGGPGRRLATPAPRGTRRRGLSVALGDSARDWSSRSS
ncbi:hypothetical protein [Embleya sp. NPDC050493]|uniref:hypothetical protein n=1 Tax=Embleya sp. NPDC050493 TaxID=3363989 RepID=UPI00379CD85F